jgi:hypothetical protein
MRVDAGQTYILGQNHAPPLGETSFVMLKCAICGEVHEPITNPSLTTNSGKQYDRMVVHVERIREEIAESKEKEETPMAPPVPGLPTEEV